MNANKWGLVATILALIGLGFAAMSTNPPFIVPNWVPYLFFAGAGLIALWLIFLLIIANKKKKMHMNPDLKIGVKIKSIETYDYYADVVGINGGGNRGDKKLTLDILLQPLKPMTIDKVSLFFWGKEIDTKIEEFTENYIFEILPWKPVTISNSKLFSVFFNIPETEAIDTKEAQIYALSGAGIPAYSDLFSINFGESK